jgi:hypothetical protein
MGPTIVIAFALGVLSLLVGGTVIPVPSFVSSVGSHLFLLESLLALLYCPLLLWVFDRPILRFEANRLQPLWKTDVLAFSAVVLPPAVISIYASSVQRVGAGLCESVLALCSLALLGYMVSGNSTLAVGLPTIWIAIQGATPATVPYASVWAPLADENTSLTSTIVWFGVFAISGALLSVFARKRRLTTAHVPERTIPRIKL